MNLCLGVIADDFTGANDTGVQFKKRGLDTIVLTDTDSLKDLLPQSGIVVIDTESRHDPPQIAYDKARDAARTFRTAGIKLIYKKIDSTLRGNIGFELDGIMDELELDLLILAPAFPKAGRVTRDGYLLIDRMPIEKTEFAKDPSDLIEEGHIPTAIQRQSQRSVGLIELSEVRRGVKLLKQRILKQREYGKQLVVIDAVTQNDLRVIAEASVACDILACGSAGLAEELSAAKNHSRKSTVIVLSGSVSQVSSGQITRAREILGAFVTAPNMFAVLKGGIAKEDELKRLVKNTVRSIKGGKDIIIRSAKSKRNALKVQEFGKRLGMSNLETNRTSLSFLGELLNKVVENQEFAGLVLIGGDTAINAIKRMEAVGTKIIEEIMPGISASEVIGGKYDGLRIVTKAGGFGSEDALICAMDYLQRRD